MLDGARESKEVSTLLYLYVKTWAKKDAQRKKGPLRSRAFLGSGGPNLVTKINFKACLRYLRYLKVHG